jgi:hypothetical protein
MELHQLIEKWALNKGNLASKMGMLTGTFCNKLNPKHPTKFTQDELVKLHNVLAELITDIDGTEIIEFNTALKQLCNG